MTNFIAEKSADLAGFRHLVVMVTAVVDYSLVLVGIFYYWALPARVDWV